jgi:hypothetical protein
MSFYERHAQGFDRVFILPAKTTTKVKENIKSLYMTTTYDIFLNEKSFDRVLIVQQPVGQLPRFTSMALGLNCASGACTISTARIGRQGISMENYLQ